MSDAVLLNGHVQFAEGTKPFTGYLRVVLEDTGRIDMAAPVLAEYSEDNFRYEGHPVPYTIRGAVAANSTHHYNVRVHISQDGSDDFKSGDYITTQSYPVSSLGASTHIDVTVQRI